jgi:uncharacterized membrane protein YuzA (DUF378 family)
MTADERTEHARWRRVVILVVAFGLVELGLFVVAYLGPALRVLMRPVYVIVGIAFLLSLHAATRRRHGDRRHGDRRHSIES